MRKLLQTGFQTGLSWMNRGLQRPPPDSAISVVESAPVLVEPILSEPTVNEVFIEEPVALLEESSSIEETPALEAAPVMAAAPVIEIPQPVVAPAPRPEGKLVALTIRGGKQYANCPCCESIWHIKSRLTDPRRPEMADVASLTCPNCEAPMRLPSEIDARKLK